MAAGAVAGLVTAFLNVRFRILHLLASILTMIALFSVNLRIMGRPNVALITQETVLPPFRDLGLSQSRQIGRATCRERERQYVSVSVDAVTAKKNKTTEQNRHIIKNKH